MAQRSLIEAPSALERLNDAGPGGRSAKAGLEPHIPACPMREQAADALRSTAKQESAAADAGITQSRLSHKLKDGTLTVAQMEAFGPAFAAEFGRQLVETYGPLATPQSRVRAAIRQIRLQCDAVEQFLEFIA